MSPKFDPALHEAIKAQPWQHASFLSGTAGRSQLQKQGGDADDQQQPLPPEDDGGGVGPVPGAPSPRDEAASDPTSDEENGGAGGASEYSPSTPERDLDCLMTPCSKHLCLLPSLQLLTALCEQRMRARV